MSEQEVDLKRWLLDLMQTTMDREGGHDAAHDFDHILRVIALAETLQASEGGDLPTIWAAVAFHDIGQERERQDGGDHAEIGAEMANELLRQTRFPQASIAVVQQAIRDHRLTGSGRPATLEGRILYDADKLDVLGALGIGRLYMITGRRQQKVYSQLPAEIGQPVQPMQIRELRNRADYAPNIEFELLFGGLPERMQTPTGRTLATERYAFMEEFFKRLEQEVQGAL